MMHGYIRQPTYSHVLFITICQRRRATPRITFCGTGTSLEHLSISFVCYAVVVIHRFRQPRRHSSLQFGWKNQLHNLTPFCVVPRLHECSQITRLLLARYSDLCGGLVAVLICATLVNTHTHTHTHCRERARERELSTSNGPTIS